MLPGSKADEVAIRGEECRMTQTAEIPSRLHKHRIVRGFQRLCVQINSASTAGWQVVVTNDTQSVVNAWSQRDHVQVYVYEVGSDFGVEDSQAESGEYRGLAIFSSEWAYKSMLLTT